MPAVAQFIVLAFAAGAITRLARQAAFAAGVPAVIVGVILSIASE